MANVITCVRIISSLLMLLFPTFSLWFYIFYGISGISDILDGYVARKTNTATEFGAQLDSLADLVFAAVCLIKILPSMEVPVWLWPWIAIIIIIKSSNILSGLVYHRRVLMLHTRASKVTGLLLFLFPVVVLQVPIAYLAIPICTIATFAAVQEGHFIRTNKF